MNIGLKHTVWFFVIANILIWGGVFLFRSSSIIEKTPIKIEQKMDTTQVAPTMAPPKNFKKVAPLNKKNSTYVQKETPVTKPQEVPQTVITATEPPRSAFMDWLSAYWPIITTVLTTLPTIALKWKELFEKLFKKKKHTHR
jgi:hypothetical protein